MSGISFSGLGSGIDSANLIQQLMSIESIPIQRMQAQGRALNARLSAVDQFNSVLRSFSSAASALNNASAYGPIKANSSDSSVATISATTGSTAGIYQLEVSKLAQTQKIASNVTGFASTTTSLQDLGVWNGNGSFVVNGKSVTVASTDTLTTLAQKINSANAGVTASLIDGGPGKAYITLSANASGEANKIQISDLGGDGVISQLGIVTGAAAVREPITGGAASIKFSSNTSTLEQLTGSTGLFAGTVSVGTGSISVSGSDTLQSLADKINNPANGTGATAIVKSITENGTTKYRLEVTGTTTFGDEGRFWQSVGVTQRGAGNTLVAAQDAEYKLDGVSLKSSTNSITNVIPNSTITLLKADVVTPVKTTFSLTRDTDQVKTSIKNFMNAYNDVVEFIDQMSSFNKDTFQSGPLFGDSMVQQLESGVGSTLFANIANAGGKFSNLTQLGFGLDDKGKLKLDEAILDKAIAEDLNGVAGLLKATGSTTGAELSFVAGTNKTRPSGVSGYDVNITQVATRSSLQSILAQSGANPATETLTFNGSLFNSTPVSINLSAGNTLDATVAQINNDSKLKDLITAENDGGKLKITSKKYGANSSFSVSSNLEADWNTSGIGTEPADQYAIVGLDIAGTINGEVATGLGQLLTGKATNTNTSGLQVLYTGSSTGTIGSVKYTSGVTAQMGGLLDSFTDSINGIVSSSSTSIKSQIDQIDASIKSLNERLTVRQETLKRKFAAMEQTLTQLKGQGDQLSAIRNSLK